MGKQRRGRRRWYIFACALATVGGLTCASGAVGHPLVEDAVDVVVAPDRITVDARVAMEEVLVEAGVDGRSDPAELRRLAVAHGDYVRRHLRMRVDDVPVVGREVIVDRPPLPSDVVAYRFEYALGKPPREVRLIQNLLVEHDPWAASCLVRIRQSDQPAFQSAPLTREGTVLFNCDWPAGAFGAATSTPGPRVEPHEARGVWRELARYGSVLVGGGLVILVHRLRRRRLSGRR